MVKFKRIYNLNSDGSYREFSRGDEGSFSDATEQFLVSKGIAAKIENEAVIKSEKEIEGVKSMPQPENKSMVNPEGFEDKSVASAKEKKKKVSKKKKSSKVDNL